MHQNYFHQLYEQKDLVQGPYLEKRAFYKSIVKFRFISHRHQHSTARIKQGQFQFIGEHIQAGAVSIYRRAYSSRGISCPLFILPSLNRQEFRGVEKNVHEATVITVRVASAPTKRFFHQGHIPLLRCIRLCKFQNDITQKFRDRRKRGKC